MLCIRKREHLKVTSGDIMFYFEKHVIEGSSVVRSQLPSLRIRSLTCCGKFMEFVLTNIGLFDERKPPVFRIVRISSFSVTWDLHRALNLKDSFWYLPKLSFAKARCSAQLVLKRIANTSRNLIVSFSESGLLDA